MGECIYQDGKKSNLYRGNALVIAVNEWEQDGRNLYSLAWFAADEKHFKNMLGLSKEFKENSFEDFGIKELTLNTRYKETEKIVALLARAKAEVTINLIAVPF
jgi:hypothetical protein